MNKAAEAPQPQAKTAFVEGLQQRLVRQFNVQVADWLDTCRELVDWEDRRLVESRSPDRLAEHAAMLEDLERVGRWLSSASTALGSEATTASEQIRSTLQDLRDSRAMWHGSVPQARKEEILRDCFNES